MTGSVAPVELVVIQPTPFCNIDCDYCYLPDRANRAVMREEVLREIFRQIFALKRAQDTFNVVWHSGEPLVLPPEWYERSFAVIGELRPPHVRIRHEFQTNGMLVTDEWCDFFRRHDILLGVSIDGPRELHDAHRRTRGGTGSFDKAMAGVRRLRTQGVEFGVITVLTGRSLDCAAELFGFYEEIDPRAIALVPEETDGVHTGNSLAGSDTVERYKDFLRTFRALMKASGKAWRIRDFDAIGQCMLAAPGAARGNAQAIVGGFLCFDYRGDLNTFSPELMAMTHAGQRPFRLGNIMEMPLADMLAGDRARALAQEVAAGVERCRSSCGYFDLCGGGSPSNKFFENGSFASAETLHCQLRIKATADVLLQDIQSALSPGAVT